MVDPCDPPNPVIQGTVHLQRELVYNLCLDTKHVSYQALFPGAGVRTRRGRLADILLTTWSVDCQDLRGFSAKIRRNYPTGRALWVVVKYKHGGMLSDINMVTLVSLHGCHSQSTTGLVPQVFVATL